MTATRAFREQARAIAPLGWVRSTAGIVGDRPGAAGAALTSRKKCARLCDVGAAPEVRLDHQNDAYHVQSACKRPRIFAAAAAACRPPATACLPLKLWTCWPSHLSQLVCCSHGGRAAWLVGLPAAAGAGAGGLHRAASGRPPPPHLWPAGECWAKQLHGLVWAACTTCQSSPSVLPKGGVGGARVE